MTNWDPEAAYQESIHFVRVITHVIRDGSKYTGRREWRVYYLGYLSGKRLFYEGKENIGNLSSWYQVPEHSWMYQSNDAELVYNFWWTMDEKLAQEYIQKYHWVVEDIDA